MKNQILNVKSYQQVVQFAADLVAPTARKQWYSLPRIDWYSLPRNEWYSLTRILHFFHRYGLDAITSAFPDREFYVVHDSIGVPADIAEDCGVHLNRSLKQHLGIPEATSLFDAE